MSKALARPIAAECFGLQATVTGVSSTARQDPDHESLSVWDLGKGLANGGHHAASSARQQVDVQVGKQFADRCGKAKMLLGARADDADDVAT
jgi:hypothetical protein